MAKNIKDGSDLIVYQDWTKTASGTTNTPSGSKAVANRTLPAWVDPIAYRQDYDPRGIEWYDPEADLNPEYLAQMDMNTPISWGNQSFNQYGDDSSPEMQGTRGWLNPKYTWENTKNSDVAYNPDMTTNDLNPYYVYGQTSKVYWTLHPWYISQRNDNIASALYNEWRRSKEDVAQFLSQQEWWMNSSEADRLNTIESVWKRIWDIAAKDVEKPETPEAPDLVQDTSGKLYWKTTAEEWNPKQWIDTLADANSVFKSMQEGRAKTVTDMADVGIDNLAAMIYSWSDVYWDQAWRDFRAAYPELASQVDEKVKQLKWQDAINAIANWDTLPSNNNTIGSINNNIADFANKNANWTTSSAEITNNINTMLDSNQTAQSAQELMWTLEWEMATLKNRLKNLREEANTVFKGDVPDYIVNAYMSNKAQEIQNQLSILEDRYNAAYKRYTTEVSQSQWQQEFDLKKQQLELDKKEFNLKKWATEEGIAIDRYKAKWTTATSTSNSWRELPVTTKTREEINWIIDNLVDMAYNKQLGNAQCAAWIQKYYFPKLWISIGGLSTFEAKKWLINTDEYYVPQKWDLIIIDSGAKLSDWTPAWHIWIVVQVDWDKVRYLDWNGDWKEGVAIRTTSLNNQKIAWYYDVTKWQASWISAWTFSDADLWMFEDYLNWDLKDYQIKDLMNRYWVDENWLWNLANEALKQADEEETTTSSDKTDIKGTTYKTDTEWYTESDLSSIKVPDDVYIVDDGYQSMKVDPNSAEWKKLAQEYRIKKAKEMWIQPSGWTSWTKTTTTSNLWFDKWRTDLYQWIIDWSIDIDTAAKNTGKSKRQLRKEVEAFQNAMDEWYDAYWYEGRNIDPELWFDPNRAEIYRWLIQNNFAVPWTQDDQKLLQLWLNPKDKNAWNVAIDEAHKYHERAKYNIVDEQVLELTRALEFIIAQGATQAQRRWWGTYATSRWEMIDWNMYWNYIKNNWTLDHFEDIKKNWLTFWNLTEWELKIISTAANALVSNWRGATAWTFKTELRAAYNSLRKELWYEELSWDEFNAMYWIEDWGENADWKNFLALEDSVDNTRPFWLWWTTNYRTYQGKDYNKWTEWYEKYWPWRTWLTSTRDDLFNNK